MYIYLGDTREILRIMYSALYYYELLWSMMDVEFATPENVEHIFPSEYRRVTFEQQYYQSTCSFIGDSVGLQNLLFFLYFYV